MNINGYAPFLINTLDTIVGGVDMLINYNTTNNGLPSSHRWQVLYFVNVIKISSSFSTTVLVISHTVTFC